LVEEIISLAVLGGIILSGVVLFLYGVSFITYLEMEKVPVKEEKRKRNK
jgi:hypothetical protein